MFHKLVFSVVLDWAYFALVGFILGVSALMILAISDCCESLLALIAYIRFVPGMRSLVNKQVAFFSKNLATSNCIALKEVLPTMAGLHMKV